MSVCVPASDSNLDVLKATYQAWHDSKGMDSLAWLDMFADGFRISSIDDGAPGLAFAKPRKSKQDAVDYLMALTSDGRMIHWSPETYVSEGDRVAMFGTCAWENKATGKIAEVRSAHLWRFDKGKAVGLIEVFDSARPVQAATP